MKSLLTLFVFLGGFTVALGQNAIAKTTATQTKILKEKGTIEFVLPKNLTSKDVKEYSKYYTKMFTVKFDERSHKATINMVENSPRNRFVIIRFLSACNVDSVVVDKNKLLLDDFAKRYLK